jgi:5-hydroxyisourate hydrolase-like protein (transthyretin family)
VIANGAHSRAVRSWLVAASLPLLLVLAPTGPRAGTAVLSGVVRDTLTGLPIAGATAYVFAAAPLRGTGLLCPTCYPDCGKWTRTGPDGRFRIAGVDDSLRFQLILTARGRRPRFARNVVAGRESVAVALAMRPVAPDSFTARGRVLTPEGEPANGAVVELVGIRQGQHRLYGLLGEDVAAVTDSSGRFELTTPRQFEFWSALGDMPDSARTFTLKVEARGLAAQAVPDFPNAAITTPDVRLGRGASLTGLVRLEGRPLAGVEVGLVQVNRLPDRFVGARTVVTDERGRWLITGVVPDEPCVLYGCADSFREWGSAPVVEIVTPPEDSIAEVAALEPLPRRRLTGRVTAAGRPAPAGTRVAVFRHRAWDVLSHMVTDADGRFSCDALPPDASQLAVELGEDYHLSPTTRGYDEQRGQAVVLPASGDVLDLEVRFDPGPWRLAPHVQEQEQRLLESAGTRRR